MFIILTRKIFFSIFKDLFTFYHYKNIFFKGKNL